MFWTSHYARLCLAKHPLLFLTKQRQSYRSLCIRLRLQLRPSLRLGLNRDLCPDLNLSLNLNLDLPLLQKLFR
jgi:hypothetical protein